MRHLYDRSEVVRHGIASGARYLWRNGRDRQLVLDEVLRAGAIGGDGLCSGDLNPEDYRRQDARRAKEAKQVAEFWRRYLAEQNKGVERAIERMTPEQRAEISGQLPPPDDAPRDPLALSARERAALAGAPAETAMLAVMKMRGLTS